MAYRNRVELIGRLGDNPEIIDLDDDRIAVNISIATTKKYRDQEGDIQEHTEWHDIAIYGHTADFAAEYLVKGMLISVVASLRTRQYQDRDSGKNRRVKEIVVNERQHEVQILSWPKEREEEEEKPARRAQPKGSSRTAGKPKTHSTSRSNGSSQRAANKKPPRKPQPRKEEPEYEDEDEDDIPSRSRSYSRKDEVDTSQYATPPSDWDEDNDAPF